MRRPRPMSWLYEQVSHSDVSLMEYLRNEVDPVLVKEAKRVAAVQTGLFLGVTGLAVALGLATELRDKEEIAKDTIVTEVPETLLENIDELIYFGAAGLTTLIAMDTAELYGVAKRREEELKDTQKSLL